ncbi:MAG: N-acetyltransferase [Caldilineaceae bacterium]|nr:N-acetyltransferase [Caldilineaceae bacterium]
MPQVLQKQDQSRYQQAINQVRGWFRTRSGRVVTARLIQPEDADALEEFFYRLSPESRRRRFHQNMENIDATLMRTTLSSFAGVDNRTQGGAVIAQAEDPDGRRRIVGVARLGRPANRPTSPMAEAAIVIRDDYQGEGVGTELLRRLVLLAKQMEIKTMAAIIEGDNEAAIRLFRELGLPTEIEHSAGETTLLIEMPGA